ncbi:hypothetical protein GCM10010377_81750 [Streptomyces viridiviolaceus]|nr:hypothetical protein GCM10010377_81750 [Streptomyces viridiviolaceus]
MRQSHTGNPARPRRPPRSPARHERVIASLDAPDRPVSGHVAGMTRAHTAHALGPDHITPKQSGEAAERDAEKTRKPAPA